MHRYAAPLFFALATALPAPPASALDKVDPYICPTAAHGSGMECFLEAVPQTYTMCRQIKSIEIIEFGLSGAQEGVHGAKTEYCIDKHKLSIARPYQAALREEARSKETVQSLRQLYDVWVESLAKLIPAPDEADEVYKQRVVHPYEEFNERIRAIRNLHEASAKPAAKPAAPSKRKKKGS
ncbi:MAG: hypothetical protein E6H55_01010 [Betaproteobacteria bacterium]|nr:MAG: hypothetical protein E6H55_01010 [Betaproteobacteria bacterium]